MSREKSFAVSIETVTRRTAYFSADSREELQERLRERDSYVPEPDVAERVRPCQPLGDTVTRIEEVTRPEAGRAMKRIVAMDKAFREKEDDS